MARNLALVAVACVALLLTVIYWPVETASAAPVPKPVPPDCGQCNCIQWSMYGKWVSTWNNGTDFELYGNLNANNEVEVGLLQAATGYGVLKLDDLSCIEKQEDHQNSTCRKVPVLLPGGGVATIWEQDYTNGDFDICVPNLNVLNAGDFVQAQNLRIKIGPPLERMWLHCECVAN